MSSRRSTSRRYCTKALRRNRNRARLFETLEPRMMLNADWHNRSSPLDVNNDWLLTPMDALLVINRLNSDGAEVLPVRSNTLDFYYDVNGDKLSSPMDVLLIINQLNQGGSRIVIPSYSEGESGVSPAGFISISMAKSPGVVGQSVALSTSIEVGRKEFNEMGLFVVDGPDGSVQGILPSSPDYAAAVFQSSQRHVLYSRASALATEREVVFPAGRYISVYVLQQYSSSDNPTDHLRVRESANGSMQIGWEEQMSVVPNWPVVGDRGYDDVTVDMEFGEPFDGNAPPVIAAIPNQTIDELTELSIQLTVVDPNSAPGELAWSKTSGPTGVQVNAQTGMLTWIPSENDGPGQFEVTVSVFDGALSNSRSFMVRVDEVNVAPTIAPLGDQVVGVGATLSVTAVAADADIPSNALTYRLDASPIGATIDSQSGLIRWTPSAAGESDFVVRVTDAGGLFATTSFRVTARDDSLLSEGSAFQTELSRELTLPNDTSALRVTFEAPLFDFSSKHTIRDAFEIEVTDLDGNPLSFPYAPNRDAVYNWSEGLGPVFGVGVATTTNPSGQQSSATINLSGLAAGSRIRAIARLVNNDSDVATSVVIRGFEVIPASGVLPAGVSGAGSRVAEFAALDISKLSDVSGSFVPSYGRTTLAGDNNQLLTELMVTNRGNQTVTGRIIVAIDNISEPNAHAMHPDGFTPEGSPYFDLTAGMNAQPLELGQSLGSREIAFLNNSGERFTYKLRTLAALNVAPTDFTTQPLNSIEAGKTYRYASRATDPDGQALRYSLQVGPESLQIDAQTGQLTWDTAIADVGSHRVTVRATDPYGLYVEQSFAVQVLDTLQNRPPNFITDPVTDAIASSGFEITTVATGANPAGIGVISGFRGPRLVSANSGDQTIGVYAGEKNDRFDDSSAYSTGFPTADGQLFDVGYSVDIGLPTFRSNNESNGVVGLDQGDLDGDGILDLVALYTYHAPDVGQSYQVVVSTMLGDGDGGFGSPLEIYRRSIGTNIYDIRNLLLRDVNGDGALDVLAVERRQDPRLISILGHGDGTFAAAVEQTFTKSLSDFRVADIDEDGHVDLVGRTAVLGFGANYEAVWLRGNGDGTFTEPTVIGAAGGAPTCCYQTQVRPLDIADMNGDGHLDVVIAGIYPRIQIYNNDGAGNFTLAADIDPPGGAFYYSPNWLRVADFTGDGLLDITFLHTGENRLDLLVSDGSGVNFTHREGSAIAGTPDNYAGTDDPTDIDGDGDLDLIFGHSNGDWTSTKVAINDGTGNFSITEYAMVDFSGDIQPFEAGDIARGAMFGDYNRDGVVDFSYFTSGGDFNGVGIRLGTRPGEFGQTRTIPWLLGTRGEDALPGDFNGDGIVDLLDTANDQIFLGNGDGTYQAPFPAVGVSRPSGFGSSADFNRDGVDDVVAARANQKGSRYYVALANGDGTFTVSDDQAVESSFYGYSSTLIADFNQDGLPDFVAKTAVERQIEVHLNDPSNPGVFTRTFRVTLPNGSQGVNVSNWQESYAVADFTGDGIPDLVFAERDADTDNLMQIVVLAGDGLGDFSRHSELAGFDDSFIRSIYSSSYYSPGDFSAGDLNSDGFVDLVAATNAGARIFLNDGTGNFAFSSMLENPGTQQRGRDSWLVDFDEDGQLDLIQTGSGGNGPLIVRLGNGDGTFLKPQQVGLVGAIPGNISRQPFADLDGDGHLDFVYATGFVGNYSSDTASIFAGRRADLVDMLAVDLNGDGNEEVLAIQEQMDRLQIFVGDNLGGFTRQPDLLTGRAPQAVAAVDLDGDGQLELLTTDRASRSLSVFTGTVGTGYKSAEFPVGLGPIDVATADINGDGHQDILVLDDAENALWLFLGDGSTTLGTPTAFALGDKPSRFSIADATGDDIVDVVITLPNTQRLMILPSDGAGTFGAPLYVDLAAAPSDVAIVDLNDDGNPDLAATLTSLNVLSVLYGRGNNQFSKAQHIQVGESPNRIALADADEDGRFDLIVANSGDATASVIYNHFDPNEVYRYDADAVDPDDDSLTYAIVDGPGGLIINAETGELLWAASPDQVGQHEVTLAANDGRGGVATQTFKIDVRPARENAAPIIATEPNVTIGANETFSYSATAVDGDNDALRYRLLDGPEGATIDSTTGEVNWDGRGQAFIYAPHGQRGDIRVPADPSLKPDSITVEGWYQLHNLPRYQYLMIDSGRNGAAYFVYVNETNQDLRVGLDFDDSDDDIRFIAPVSPEANRWYHIALTYDASTGQATLFVDGEVAGTGATITPQPLAFVPDAPTLVGHSGSSPTHAIIDSYRIWNVARSAAEIQASMAQQHENDPRIVLDYRFEDIRALTVQDNSDYGNLGFRTSNGLFPLATDGLVAPGQHDFTIVVEDGRGGYDEQSFTVNVLPELRGSIAGHVFDDLDGDGSQSDGSISPAEPSLENWHLYIDFNGNAYPDPNEPQTITDASGDYRFDGLLPGDYPVRVSPVAGYEVPNDAAQVSVTANAEAAFDLAIEQLTLSHIRGQLRTEDGTAIAYWKAYADLDDDGLRDEDEPLAVSDRNGDYALTGLAAGTYRIRPELPSGWVDAAGRDGLNVTLATDDISIDNDFVLKPTNTSVTGGVYFVTMPSTSIEARQTFRYTSIAKGIGNSAVSYDLSLAPDGMTVDPSTGLTAWRPSIDQIGEHLVILRARDASGSIALHDFTITVTAPNTPPVISGIGSLPVSPAAYVGSNYAYDIIAQDAESTTLTYALTQSPAGATIDAITGRLDWTPAASAVGSHDFTVEVTDETGASTTASWTVDVGNSSPNALPLVITLPRATAAVTTDYFSRISGNDAIGRPLTWSLTSGPTGLTVQSNGTLKWKPGNSQLGPQAVELSATTADGAAEIVTFEIQVAGRTLNAVPAIESTPITSISLGQTFAYDLQVSDADRDIFAFTLLEAPVGMSVHPSLGTIRWTPTADQLGESNVVVQVSDPSGATDVQEFKLKVSRFGGPPRITSIPATEAGVGTAFLYSVIARDAEGDPLTYSLLAAPTGMSIVETTGEISWTPTIDQLGQQDVVIQVSDGIGGTATQAFAIRVSAGAPNLPPAITSTSPRFGTVGTAFSYTLTATDPENTAITYSLGRGPDGMTVDAGSGEVTWTPTAAQAGKHVVTLIATDVGGASAVESFEFDVLAQNTSPVINSAAPASVAAGARFSYDVLASDADLDQLTFELTQAPAGAQVDSFGRIRWQTTAALIGSHDFQVKVHDPRGGEATQSFTLEVIEDIEPPKVSIIENLGDGSRNILPWQGPFTVYVRAIDNVAIESLTLTANGKDIPLDAAGTAKFTFEEWTFQRINATATAIDTNGNVTSKTISFDYDFPEGWSGAGTEDIPTAAITSPSDTESVTGMVRIVGTAAHADLFGYKLSYRHVDDTGFTEFFESTNSVTNGELGVWDTSQLLNDEYVIRLEVATNAGVVNVVEHHVGLAGELKLGNFRMSFTDMVIPVAGIPIEITRIYDTLQADREGDFGYGWRLEYRNTDLRVGLPKRGLEDIGIYSALRPGVKVYLNVPGQGRQGFTFNPDIRVLPGFGGNNLVLARPRFTADPGVTSTLSAGTSGYLQVNEFGELYAPGGIPYNPASPDFGGAYVLTTREGITYRIDGSSGNLSSANDRSGNQLTFSDAGISTNGSQLVDVQRDSLQRITGIVGPDGNGTQYGYQGALLVQFVDQESNVTTFGYDQKRRLNDVVDPLGRSIAKTTYSTDGRLLSTTDANGRTINFPHSGETNQQIIEDENGSLTVLEFDSQGRIVQETNPLGGVLRREFDSAGRVLVQIDEAGERIVNQYDARGNLVSQTDRNGNTLRLTYDSRDLPTSLTTASGRTTRFRYNDAGLLTARISETGEILESIEYDERGNPVRMTDAAGQTDALEYNALGVAIAEIDSLGQRVELAVNASGLSTSRMDARGNVVGFVRDGRGLVTDIQGPDGKTVKRHFNAAAELTGLTTPTGGRTQFSVDGLGNETLLVDAQGGAQNRTYNLTGDLISFVDENGNLTRYEYDALGRRTKTIHSDGGTELFGYDAVGNLIQSTDALGNTTRFEYDAERKLILERDAIGRVTTYTYDADGRTTQISGPDGTRIAYEYDTSGNQVRTRMPDGKVVQREFDRLGNVIAEIDPVGLTTRYTYDAAGQLIAVVAPDAGISRNSYDANGNVIGQTDPLGNVTTFEYDIYNRLESKTYPSGDRERFAYNQDGWQTSTTAPNGDETVSVFDQNGNVLQRRFADGSQESFTYSATNRVLQATNQFGSVSMTYDSRDRLSTIGYPDGSQVRYGYDAHGNRTSLIAVDFDGNEYTTTYRYDALNRLAAVRDTEGGETLYEYNAAGRILAVAYPNDMRTVYTYTAAGNVKSVETTLGGITVERLEYAFGESNERTMVTQLDGRKSVFTYDTALRLIAENQVEASGDSVFQHVYTYDTAGNRRSIADASGSNKLLTYNVNNQLVNFGERTFTYDANGRLSLETGNNHRVEYRYDAEDQLIRVDSNGSVVEYVYDALGNRVAEIRDGARTNFLLDFRPDGIHQVLAEYQTAEAFDVQYVYGYQRISRSDATGTAYFHYDASQNVVALSNVVGAVTDRYVMTAFGELLEHVGASDNRYQFASERVDSQNGLVHLRARDYAPEQGLFLTRDPFAGVLNDPTSLHRYQYAHRNPLSNTDPTGEITLSEQAFTGALIGGLSSGIGGYLGGKRGKELVFETFVGAAFGAVGGQFGGALSKAFATQFTQAKVFTTIITNPTVIKYSPRLVHAIPNTVLGITEDLTKGFGTGSFRDPGFASSVAFNAAANFFFNILVGPGQIGVMEVQRAVPTGRQLGESGIATYEIFTKAARERAAPKFREMVTYFGDGNFTRYEEFFLQFLNDTTKFLVSQVISIHAS